MKNKASIFICLIICVSLSSCASFHPAPWQPIGEYVGPQTSKVIIRNFTFDNIEFIEGPLTGLILGKNEYYITSLPWGTQYHRWNQVVMQRNLVRTYDETIIITHRSRTVTISPPLTDTPFATRGNGAMDVTEW